MWKNFPAGAIKSRTYTYEKKRTTPQPRVLIYIRSSFLFCVSVRSRQKHYCCVINPLAATGIVLFKHIENVLLGIYIYPIIAFNFFFFWWCYCALYVRDMQNKFAHWYTCIQNMFNIFACIHIEIKYCASFIYTIPMYVLSSIVRKIGLQCSNACIWFILIFFLFCCIALLCSSI